MFSAMPSAKVFITDKGFDSDDFREALRERGVTACIPQRRSWKLFIPYDKELYKTRHKIENLFGKLKDWRRIARRYDRCSHTIFSAICIAASCAFYLNQ
jgi:transposase